MTNSLPLVEIKLPPGIQRDKTAYEAGKAVIDANRVRWYNDRIYSIGGWQKYTIFNSGIFDTVTGVPRKLFAWTSLQGDKNLVIATNTDVLVVENGGWKSIKPVGLVDGVSSNQVKSGWGAGAWGGNNDGSASVGPEDTGWGESKANITEKMRLWSIDNYGEDLVLNPSGETIYFWDYSGGSTTKAAPIANAPAAVNFSFIFEPIPFVFACGCTNVAGDFDPMVIRWSSDDNYESWTPGVPGSTSGEIKLQGGAELIGALNSRVSTLIWSDTNLFQVTFTNGQDAPFSFDSIGSNCGLVSPNAMIEVEGTAYWMSPTGFFKYDGALSKQRTSLDTTIFGAGPLGLNRFQQGKVYCGLNTEFNEIWWFYPTNQDPENNRYAVYNYKSGAWYDGSIRRTAWLDSQLYSSPLAASEDGYVWQHEFGTDAGDEPLNAYVKTGLFALDEGTEVMYCDRFVPDFNIVGDATLCLFSQKYPASLEVNKKGPYVFSSDTEHIDFRIRGRTLQFLIEQNSLGSRFDMGIHRIRVTKDGSR